MNTRSAVAGIACVALAVPAIALAAVPQFEGKAGTAVVSIETKGSGDNIARVKSFSWDGLKCGGDKFTGGTSKSIKVKGGAFKSTQPVGGVEVALKLVLKGKFTAHGTKARGTLKIKGACHTGKVKWSAKLAPQQGQQQG